MLSEAEVRAYVMDPTKCPYCGEDSLTGTSMEAEGAFIKNSVECENPECGKHFIELFRIVGIAEPQDIIETPEKPKLVLP